MEDQNVAYAAHDGSFAYYYCYEEHPRAEDYILHNDKRYEILFFLRGKGEFYIEGSRYALEPYDLIIISDKELHRLVIDESQPYERAVIHLRSDFLPPFAIQGVDILEAFKARKLGSGNKINSATVRGTDVAMLFRQLHTYCTQETPSAELAAKCAIVQLLHTLIPLYSKESFTLHGQAAGRKAHELLAYINGNLNEDLSLDVLSERFFLTKFHLCRLFKEATGFSINRYIVYKRVIRADELISSGFSPTQACFLSGFNDYSNFYKAYKKTMGASPRRGKNS